MFGFPCYCTLTDNVLHCRLDFQCPSLEFACRLLHAAVEEVIHVEVWFPAISGCHPAKMCRNAMRGCIFSHLHGQGVFFSLNHIQYSIFDLVVVVGCMLCCGRLSHSPLLSGLGIESSSPSFNRCLRSAAS